MSEHQETEIRFLEVDSETLVANVIKSGGRDQGRYLLEEIIFYDQNLSWQNVHRQFLRIRKVGEQQFLTFKQAHHNTLTAEQIELEIGDAEAMATLLERIGLLRYRTVHKYRHTFTLESVTIDIDTYPHIPTFVEIEGPDEVALQTAVATLGLKWNEHTTQDAKDIIEERYGIPMSTMRWFTFERFE